MESKKKNQPSAQVGPSPTLSNDEAVDVLSASFSLNLIKPEEPQMFLTEFHAVLHSVQPVYGAQHPPLDPCLRRT